MIVDEIGFELKDGRNALLRSPGYDDIPGMIEYLYLTSKETEYLLRYPEECGKYTEDVERQVIDRANGSPNEVMLLCTVEGKIAGSCNLRWSSGIKTRHRASIGIAVVRKYWGLGIGTKMLSELIHIAEQNENLLQVELEYIEGNVRARNLYEKMGFTVTGVRPDSIRLRDGTLLNEYSMMRKLRR